MKVDAVRYRAVLEIPDSIPEEFHDEFREGDAIFRQKMVNKYEKLTELKAADEKYNRHGLNRSSNVYLFGDLWF